MKLPMLPRNIERVGDDEEFAFACHRSVRCFTHCCRELELSLTPYDVLRLKNSLTLHSREFLDRYVILEQDDEDVFPRLYLTMVDDGNAGCVFVTKEGCSVYRDRPGACRAYPLGRASMRKADKGREEFYVLLREDHCKGFEEPPRQTPLRYSADQELDIYNRMNDALLPLFQHDRIRQGMRLSKEQTELLILALYDLDTFRQKLFSGAICSSPPPAPLQKELLDDEKLLRHSLEWLQGRLFGGAEAE
jgi:hypothetical protein